MGLLLLLFLSSAAFAQQDCVDCNRRIAPQDQLAKLGQALAPGFCEQQIRIAAENDAKALQLAEKELTDVMKVQREPSAVVEAADKKFRAISGGAALTCAQVEDIRFLADTLRYRQAQLQKTIDFNVTFADETEKLAEPFSLRELTEKALCVQACVQKSDDYLSAITAEHPCALSCQAGAALLAEAGSPAVTRMLLNPACLNPEYGSMPSSKAMALARQSKETEKELVQKIVGTWKESKARILAAQAWTSERLAAVETAAGKNRGRQCGLDKALPLVKNATSLIRAPGPDNAGSGFYFSAGGKTFLATARHVTAKGEAYDDETFSVLIDDKPDLHYFAHQAGRYDFTNDAVIKEEAFAKTPLPLVSAKKRPEPGQNFYLAGFAGIRRGKFSTFRCRFLGYGESVRGANAYFLHCPADGFLEGMSGGPLVDETGTAWGIVANHGERADVVAVSPLAQGEDGPVIGLTETFLSEHCYGPLQAVGKAHRCQVFPGSREKP